MPTSNSEVYDLVQAIRLLGSKLSYNGSSLTNKQRAELVENAENLAIAAREPFENLYYLGTMTAQNSAIRTAIDMGVFEKIPTDGSDIGVAGLAAGLKVDEMLLVRIMRALTSAHLFTETSPSHYTHNAYSSIFLTPSNRDMFQQMYDFLGLGVYTMPSFLASTNYANPTDYAHGAFQYGHKTTLGFFEYVAADPERAKVFHSGMQSLASIGDAGRAAEPYAFEEELCAEGWGKGEGEGEVLIVDVGGGRGQALSAIKECYPRLEGRMVLQDQAEVVEDVKRSGLPGFIEPMAASFFEPQPVKGARIYHFRRIFHDWSDEVSLRILRNTVPAMTSHSRILITDTVIPEIGAPRHVAMQDINMMSFGGMERTKVQWESLLREAGLSVKKYWARDGDLQNTIEAVVKS